MLYIYTAPNDTKFEHLAKKGPRMPYIYVPNDTQFELTVVAKKVLPPLSVVAIFSLPPLSVVLDSTTDSSA